MLDDISSISVVFEGESLSRRGKHMRRVGNFMAKTQPEQVQETKAVIKHSKQTSTLEDCEQSSRPTAVAPSGIKRKISTEDPSNEVQKKQKRTGSTTVADLRVEQATESKADLRAVLALPGNTHGRPGERPQKSQSNPLPCQCRTSRSIPWRRPSLPAALVWRGTPLFLNSGMMKPLDNGPSPTICDDILVREPSGLDDEQKPHIQEQAGPKLVKRATIHRRIDEDFDVYEVGQGSQLILPTETAVGRRRALVIAIQYKGQEWPGYEPGKAPMELRGPYEDAKDICKLLIDQGYRPQDIQLMTDDLETHPNENDIPTHDNIIRALEDLVAWARPNDRLFLYFAGHGKQIEDKNHDEDDGKDETIIPCDWATHFGYRDEGLIVDDFLREAYIDKLPKGSQLTAVFDSCHAGTILDLPEVYPAHQYEAIHALYKIEPSCTRGEVAARVMCFAACMDSQDAWNLGSRGQFTKAFTGAMRKFKKETGSNPTVQQLFDYIAAKLSLLQQKKIIQNPLLTGSFKIVADELQKPVLL